MGKLKVASKIWTRSKPEALCLIVGALIFITAFGWAVAEDNPPPTTTSNAAHQSISSLKIAPTPERLKIAVGCLFSTEFMRKYDFTPLGYKEGEWVLVRYHVGTIPGIEPTPGAYKVVFYSKDGKRATLLDAEPDGHGGFFGSANDYYLRKQGSHWQVIEGEGGDVDYEAVERLVKRMSAKPLYRVQLVPGGKECTDN